MVYYTTFGELQNNLKEYFEHTGKRMQFPEMTNYLYHNGQLCADRPEASHIKVAFDEMSDDEFEKVMDATIVSVTPSSQELPRKVWEKDIIPERKDVFVIRHPRYTRPFLHSHDYFEIDFVSSGSCNFFFEKESRVLSKGELCIIAPGSDHDLLINDDKSMVFCIMIRKSTFDTTFFSLLSQKDLLAQFFHNILLGNTQPNYLLFFAKDTKQISVIMRHAFMECYKHDSYNNVCCVSWINLMFVEMLRNYSQTLQFYNYQMGSDFSLVLQYIQHNYRNVTLSSLAQFFHYSEPHLRTLIKQNTGCKFTALIKQLRMSDAVKLLSSTDLKIGEIAEHVGYNSSDHFSRVFRRTYGVPPQEYKKLHQPDDKDFPS